MARLTLELGGKSAAIVLGDADLPLTIERLAPHTMPFSGQICFAQTRLLVPRSRRDEVTEAYTSVVSGLAIGNPWEPATQLGPLATSTHLNRVMGYIERGRAEGATLATGGRRVDRKGFYLEPTVFTDVKPEMAIAREEIFGPVLATLTFETVEEAVKIANDVVYGLAAAVWTKDITKAHRVARALRAGVVYVNCYDADDITVPFGGFKQSGIGRDKSLHAFDKYTELKTTWIDLS